LRVPWASEEDELEAVTGGETVAIGTSLSASLNQVMVDAGLRPPLVLRAQLSKFVWTCSIQGEISGGMENLTVRLALLYVMRPQMPTWTP